MAKTRGHEVIKGSWDNISAWEHLKPLKGRSKHFKTGCRILSSIWCTWTPPGSRTNFGKCHFSENCPNPGVRVAARQRSTLSHGLALSTDPPHAILQTPAGSVPSSPLRGHLLLPVSGTRTWRTACPDTQTRS